MKQTEDIQYAKRERQPSIRSINPSPPQDAVCGCQGVTYRAVSAVIRPMSDGIDPVIELLLRYLETSEADRRHTVCNEGETAINKKHQSKPAPGCGGRLSGRHVQIYQCRHTADVGRDRSGQLIVVEIPGDK